MQLSFSVIDPAMPMPMLVQLSISAAFVPQIPRFTRRGYIMIHRMGFGVAQFDSRGQQRQKKGNVLHTIARSE
jgi:hypothetical protein